MPTSPKTILDLLTEVRDRAKEGSLRLVGARNVLPIETAGPELRELLADEMCRLEPFDIGRHCILYYGFNDAPQLRLRLGKRVTDEVPFERPVARA
jgi:hypothetical protein